MYLYTHIHSCICIRTHIHGYAYIYVYINTYAYVYVYVYVCVCVLAIDFAQLDMWKLLQSHCPSSLTFDHFKPTFFNVRSSCHYVTWLMPSRNNFALIPPAPPPSRHPVTI